MTSVFNARKRESTRGRRAHGVTSYYYRFVRRTTFVLIKTVFAGVGPDRRAVYRKYFLELELIDFFPSAFHYLHAFGPPRENPRGKSALEISIKNAVSKRFPGARESQTNPVLVFLSDLT